MSEKCPTGKCPAGACRCGGRHESSSVDLGTTLAPGMPYSDLPKESIKVPFSIKGTATGGK